MVDKNKYATPKFRLVFRRTNRDIIMQVVAADMDHDRVIACAYSHELPRYGVKAGLTNYAAAYCTGLLLARRVNKAFNLDYEGQTEVDGEFFEVEAEEKGGAPFKAVLDVGLQRTTSGARVFGGLKGAADGGLDIPHSAKRFPRSDDHDHRAYIFGQHVASYMEMLSNDDPEKFNRQFARYIKNGVTHENMEEMYEEAHAAIRANPERKREATQKGYFPDGIKAPRSGPRGAPTDYPKKQWQSQKKSIQQRKGRIKQILLAAGIKSIPKLVLQK
jgi:large subunit ribosomal protein L5e